MKKLFYAFSVLLLILVTFGTEVQAETGVRYRTFTLSDGRLVPTQTAYVPIDFMTELGGEPIGNPQDIYIDQNDVIYIATRTTQGQIMRYDMTAQELTIIGAGFLNDPRGVHVNSVGDIFVADYGNRVAYRLDAAGNILQRFDRPDSPLFGDSSFTPEKILSDARGNVYILNDATSSRGMMQYSNTGVFLGYFGTNTIQPTLRTILQFTFFTQEQLDQLFNISPPRVYNLAIDQRGLIHTVSRGTEGDGVKRLNISGGNLLPDMFHPSDLVDVFVGPIGNIYVITQSGHIYEYDIEGNLLFRFGGQFGSSETQGFISTPTAIAADSSFNLYVLDEARGSEGLTIFYPTQFATQVHTALTFYQDGNYAESKEPWQEVLKMNDFFDLAHRGLGNAYFSLGEYELALEEYYIANDRAGYSEAYWEVRNIWLLANVGNVIGGMFFLIAAFVVNIKAQFVPKLLEPVKKGIAKSREKVKLLDDLLYVFTYLKNPAESSYHIKRKNRVNTFSATVLLLIYFALYVYYIYNLNFLFNFRRLENINLAEEVIKVLLPIGLWVVCNALIGSIREGEGRIKDVYITTIYSLAPFFLLLPVITWLSHGLTYNEGFLISFAHTIAIGLAGIYFFFMVKETHFYTVKETIQSILVTAFTMIMMLLGVIIVYVLLNELFMLFRDIWLEVYYRVFSS